MITTFTNIIIAVYFICCVINFFLLNQIDKNLNFSGAKNSLLILGGFFTLPYVIYKLKG